MHGHMHMHMSSHTPPPQQPHASTRNTGPPLSAAPYTFCLVFCFRGAQVKFGAVDCTAHQATCGQFGVQGYPTIKVFGTNKEAPSDYQAGRDSGSIVSEANRLWGQNAKPREVRGSLWL